MGSFLYIDVDNIKQMCYNISIELNNKGGFYMSKFIVDGIDIKNIKETRKQEELMGTMMKLKLAQIEKGNKLSKSQIEKTNKYIDELKEEYLDIERDKITKRRKGE